MESALENVDPRRHRTYHDEERGKVGKWQSRQKFVYTILRLDLIRIAEETPCKELTLRTDSIIISMNINMNVMKRVIHELTFIYVIATAIAFVMGMILRVLLHIIYSIAATISSVSFSNILPSA